MADITLGELRDYWRDNKNAVEAVDTKMDTLLNSQDVDDNLSVKQTGSNKELASDNSIVISGGSNIDLFYDTQKFPFVGVGIRFESEQIFGSNEDFILQIYDYTLDGEAPTIIRRDIDEDSKHEHNRENIRYRWIFRAIGEEIRVRLFNETDSDIEINSYIIGGCF